MTDLVLYAGLGLAAGVLYAGIGLGVVTTFKATGVINLAQVGLAMWGAFTYARLREDGTLVLPVPGLPSPSLGGPATAVTALVIALVASAVMGALAYVLVFRPVRRASTVANLVASVGLLLVIQSIIIVQFGSVAVPVDQVLPTGNVSVGGAEVPLDRLWAAGVTVAVAVALAAWFRWTRTGLAVRGASESQPNVALAGWSPDRLALTGWVLGSVVAAGLTILVAPSVNLSPVAFGLLVVPTLAAALVGRLSSVLATCAGGLALGVLQSVIGDLSTQGWWPSWARVGVAQLLPFLAVAAVLVVLGQRLPFRGDPTEARLPRVSPRRPRVTVVLVASAVGLAAVALTTGTYRFGVITSMVLVVLSLSVVVLTGYTGQLSLGQAAVAGIGGFALAKLGTGVPFPVNLVLAALIATAAGLVIGAPALRIRGAQLAIVSMAGAVALESLVFKNPSFTAQAGEPVPAASLFGLDLAVREGDDIARLPFGVMVLVVLVVVSVAVACITAGRTGRRFLAVRSDERAAAAAGVDVARTKLLATAVASFLAGLAGALLGLVRGQLTADSFTLFVGIALIAFCTIGGITRVSGAMVAGAIGSLGIVYVVLDSQASVGQWYGLGSGVLLIVTVMANPDGVAGALAGLVASATRRLLPSGRTRTPPPGAAPAGASAPSPAPPTGAPVPGPAGVGEGGVPGSPAGAPAFSPPAGPAGTGLRLDDLRVVYGGVVAVDDVSFSVAPGEVVGLIGPNGAGKTSLVDGICGFTPSRGRVLLGERRIDGLTPHRRQRAGVGRTWQDGGLFDDLSVIDNLAVTAEEARPGDLARDLVSSSTVGRDALVAVLEAWGIAEVADRRPNELSVGRRKLVDLARATAGRPAVLLADEPAAGLDPWEGEDMARRLRAFADAGHAVVLIEHDLGLVRRTCDRLVVMDFGRVIADGEPEVVLADPRVASAYLGVDPEAGDEAVVDLEVLAPTEVPVVTTGSRP